MKRPLAYITASWYGGDSENAERAARYCRAVYEAGYAPICPALFLPLFLNDPVPQEHKDGLDMARDLLRRSRVLVVCGHTITESMKNDITVAIIFFNELCDSAFGACRFQQFYFNITYFQKSGFNFLILYCFYI